MILSARVYSIQPMSREFRERIRARKQELLELRSRRRMAKLVAAAERRKEQEPMEPDLTVPESQRLTAAEAQREAAQMLALLRRERLLEDLTDAEEAAIY